MHVRVHCKSFRARGTINAQAIRKEDIITILPAILSFGFYRLTHHTRLLCSAIIPRELHRLAIFTRCASVYASPNA